METYWVLSLHDGPVERSPPASPQARPPAPFLVFLLFPSPRLPAGPPPRPLFFSVYFFFRRPPLSARPSSAFFFQALGLWFP